MRRRRIWRLRTLMIVVAVVALSLFAWKEWLAPRPLTIVITSRQEIVSRPSFTFDSRDPKAAASARRVMERLEARGVGYRVE